MVINLDSLAQRYFVTGVSMITSVGSSGPNVMAAEWTMQISYDPMLIAVFIHSRSRTLRNIKEKKEFGVNLAAEDQTTAVSIAGGYSGKEIDKLALSRYFKMIKPRKIKSPLIQGCAINAECKLVTTKQIGDHIMVVGKVLFIRHNKKIQPLVYHKGRYFRIGSMIEPFRERVIVNQKTFDLFRKKSGTRFILKYAGVIVLSGSKILVENDPDRIPRHIPHMVPPPGVDNRKELEIYLRKIKLDIILNKKPEVKRIMLKSGRNTQRVNFILFRGTARNKVGLVFKPIKNDSLLKVLAR